MRDEEGGKKRLFTKKGERKSWKMSVGGLIYRKKRKERR